MSGSMKRMLAIAVAGIAAAACTDLNSSAENTLELSPAFQTVPVGFSANTNSFDASGDAGVPFSPSALHPAIGFGQSSNAAGGRPAGEKPSGDRHDGFGEGGLRGLLMGGGLGPDFIGAIAFGKGRGRGPFGIFSLPAACTYDSGTGRVSCPDKADHGLTVSASFAFKDEAGNAQPKFDTLTTNSVNLKIDVSGTRTRKEGTTVSVVKHSSDRTVEGLAPGKTERKMNGVASAHEDISGTKDDVKFTAVRDVNDTTTNLVVPIVDGRPTIATSGTVIRNMVVSITPEGGPTTTKSRREEVTFDGTNVVSVKITVDGTTKNCTITLPSKRLVCE
jgi:hypothetical protein